MTAPTSADAELIRRAIEVAGGASVTGDVPIGAVLVDATGAELAVACNAREATGDPTAHAELLALRAGAARLRSQGRNDGWRLSGCTLAVTVEPCTMCAGALVAARIARLVFGAWEPKTGAVGSLWDVVRDRRLTHRPLVQGGVLAQECATLLTTFFTPRRVRPSCPVCPSPMHGVSVPHERSFCPSCTPPPSISCRPPPGAETGSRRRVT